MRQKKALSEEAMLKFASVEDLISSSGGYLSSPDEAGHPRAFGAFTTKPKEIVIDQGVTSLSAGIRTMTSLPARKLGLIRRGTLAVGAYADIVVLDRETLAARATYEGHAPGVPAS